MAGSGRGSSHENTAADDFDDDLLGLDHYCNGGRTRSDPPTATSSSSSSRRKRRRTVTIDVVLKNARTLFLMMTVGLLMNRSISCRPTISNIFLLITPVFAQPHSQSTTTTRRQAEQKQHRVAVIGGGITGSFFAKYIADLESKTESCSLTSLTLFDPDHEISIRGRYINNHNATKDETRKKKKIPNISSYQTATYLLDDHGEDYEDDGRQRLLTVELAGDDGVLSKQETPLLLDMARNGNLTLRDTRSPKATDDRSSPKVEQILLANVGSVILRYTYMPDTESSSTIETVPSDGSSFVWMDSIRTSIMGLLSFPPIVWRYSIDWYVISRLLSKIKTKRQTAYELLIDNNDGVTNNRQRRGKDEEQFPTSPNDLWSRAGMNIGGGGLSLYELCDDLMIPDDKSTQHGIRSWLLAAITFGIASQGSIRSEILSVATRLVFGQEASQVQALPGLWATNSFMYHFLLADDNGIEEQYTIVGGNTKLIGSAWEQARETFRSNNCRRTEFEKSSDSLNDDDDAVRSVPAGISTVVGSVNGFELFDGGGKSLGRFDTVVMAVPIPLANIEFLIESYMDETAVLHPMPLGGLIENHDNEDFGSQDKFSAASRHHDHDGHEALPRRLPLSVTRPYIPQVSTLVRKGDLQDQVLCGSQMNTESSSSTSVRRQVFIASSSYYTISAIFQLTTPSSASGINETSDMGGSEGGESSPKDAACCYYKILSKERIPNDVIYELFGQSAEIEIEHIGAVPNLSPIGGGGNVMDTPFLMYDGATGFHGQTKSGALYYPNLVELTMPSVLEGSAMAAMAVANLLADRLDWTVKTTKYFNAGDEL